MNQMTGGPQKALAWIGKIAGHLLHPFPVGLWMNPSDVEVPGLQFDHKEDEVAFQPVQREHLDREHVPPDLVAEVGQGAADPRVAPSGILDRHPDDQLGQHLPLQWPTTAAGAPVVHCAISRRY